MIVDTHVHITHRLFDGEPPCIGEYNKKYGAINNIKRHDLITEMRKRGIAFVIEPGIDFDSNEKILKLSKEYKGFIYPALGVHPTRTYQTSLKKRKDLEKLIVENRINAIGETGLDYHLDRKQQHRFFQKNWFVWHIKMANKYKLPLILHIRLADKDAIKILRRYKKHIAGGVCHCFNGGIESALIYTNELGLKLGIGGSILQENCSELIEVVRNISLESLVLETDSPYVKPIKTDGITGKQWKKARNTSFILYEVVNKIAEIKQLDVHEVERVTTENAIKLFDIK